MRRVRITIALTVVFYWITTMGIPFLKGPTH